MTATLPHPGATARSAPTRPTTIELGDGLALEVTPCHRVARWVVGWRCDGLLADPHPERTIGLAYRVLTDRYPDGGGFVLIVPAPDAGATS